VTKLCLTSSSIHPRRSLLLLHRHGVAAWSLDQSCSCTDHTMCRVVRLHTVLLQPTSAHGSLVFIHRSDSLVSLVHAAIVGLHCDLSRISCFTNVRHPCSSAWLHELHNRLQRFLGTLKLHLWLHIYNFIRIYIYNFIWIYIYIIGKECLWLSIYKLCIN
jgi:hypothetical protein